MVPGIELMSESRKFAICNLENPKYNIWMMTIYDLLNSNSPKLASIQTKKIHLIHACIINLYLDISK